MTKWAVEVTEFNIVYEPGKAIKARTVADLIKETTINKAIEHKWLMYVDSSSMVGGSGGGIILVSPEGDQLEYVAKFRFTASNNEAKYEALIKGLEMAVRLGVHHLASYFDSQLVS